MRSTEATTIRVNGEEHVLRVPAHTTLADALRDHLGLTGTHLGCEHGACGACTVLVDGVALRSCLLFAFQADGAEVTTVEGLAPPGTLGPIQQAFAEQHGQQCGFCTAGMLMTSAAFLRGNDDPDDDEIRDALAGNLCRCTGYRDIVRSVREAAKKLRNTQSEERR